MARAVGGTHRWPSGFCLKQLPGGGVTFVFIWGNREGHRVKEEAH